MKYSDFSLSQWLTHLETRHIQEIQLGLSRVFNVAEGLGLLHVKSKVITVAGTNGKGSTVAALEALYMSAGYRVGAYTSPHLISFTERIRINQQAISEDSLCKAFEFIELSRQAIALTYFEMTTLAALLLFRDAALDVIILEVGLGGRLDATNIIDSDVAVITSIDFDHQAYLGDTLEQIGYEKAGIMRSGKPVIYADTSIPQSIVQHAYDVGATLYRCADDFKYALNGRELSIDMVHHRQWCLPKPRIHELSATAAVIATELLKADLPISELAYENAMKTVFNPGRLEYHPGPKALLFDVAHNAQSARLLADFVSKLKVSGQIRAVFSALIDKDHEGLIAPMRALISTWYVAPLEGKRASPVETLCDVIKINNISEIIICEDLLTAYHTVLNDAKLGDLIVVFGSFLVVGSVMASLAGQKQENI